MVSEQLDTGSFPMTEPHPAPFFDTGPQFEPLQSYESEALGFDAETFGADGVVDYTPLLDSAPLPRLLVTKGMVTKDVVTKDVIGRVVAADPPDRAPEAGFQFVKRWKFALLLVGVWLAAAAVGAGLYYWWFHSLDKTWTEAGVLLYVIVCMVVALLVSMAERPMLAALSAAVMSVPFASACGAGLLCGGYAFGWVTP